MAPLAGKHVLIIGGSSGIGFGVARVALAEGARVTIASSSDAKVRAAVERLGGGDKVAAEVLDARKESEIKALFDRVGTIDHLVFTAGEPIPSAGNSLAEVDFAQIKPLMDLRYYSVLLCARNAPGHIKESITFTSGTPGVRPMPGMSSVAGLAAALINTARALAIDVAPLRVNCICLGLIETELLEHFPAEMKEAFVKKAVSSQPVARIGTPEEAGEAYAFTMKCTYLTGQTIIVDGGNTLV